jgi:hypothetical protein
MATAVAKLKPSGLDDQKELMKDDIELHTLHLFIRGLAQADIAHTITAGSVERTVDGASTVTIDCNDPDLELQVSGLLTTHTDINIDGLYFRMASAERQGDTLTLTFEDREVSLLRQNDGFMKANRDSMTRAEFVHAMVRQVKEVHIRFFCPQEHVTQKVAPDPNDSTGNDLARGGGFAPGANVTVKGINASAIQKKNIDTVLATGVSMGAVQLELVAAVETITVESSCMNLSYGDRDSVGIFQQRNSPPWNKRNRRDVSQAATTFFEQAKSYLQLSRARGFSNISSWTLAQAVQISAFPDRYKQVATEAEATVSLWQGTGNNAQGSPLSGNSFLDGSSGGSGYEFTRGTMDDLGRVTKETSWDAAHRLADEVHWRCFMVSGTLYFIDDEYLMKSRPRMTFDRDYRHQGVDDLDFDYDRQKSNARITITCEIHRWGAPPGAVVKLDNLGPITGRWLVQDIKRDLFSTRASITLIKPLPQLPEPPPGQGQITPDSLIVGPTSAQSQAIVQAAQKALSEKNRYTYRQYRPMAKSLFDAFAYNHTDCSAFVTLCYKAAGAPDPNGLNYNGSGYTGTLWPRGFFVGKNTKDAMPADLAFFGLDPSPRGTPIPTHVALYIGGGQVIEFGSTPIAQNPIAGRSDFIGFRRYTDPGQSGH